jgi:hypothetical protein
VGEEVAEGEALEVAVESADMKPIRAESPTRRIRRATDTCAMEALGTLIGLSIGVVLVAGVLIRLFARSQRRGE